MSSRKELLSPIDTITTDMTGAPATAISLVATIITASPVVLNMMMTMSVIPDRQSAVMESLVLVRANSSRRMSPKRSQSM